MKFAVQVIAATCAGLALFVNAGLGAAEINVLGVLGFRSVIEELGPRFEQATGHRLTVDLTTSGALIKRVEQGEMPDLVIMPDRSITRLMKDGRADAANVTRIARSGLGLAVRAGAPKPDISTPDAVRQVLLTAQSIAYANPAHGAASGIHIAKMLDVLGIADQIKTKTVFLPKAGSVGVLVATGEAELALHQIQELIPVAGIDIVGPLPAGLQDHLVFAAAIMNGGRNAAAARALVDFLRTPQSASTIRAKGMEPVAN